MKLVGALLPLDPDVDDFPGYFAGASLKLDVEADHAAVAQGDFPGYFAGASLKHAALEQPDITCCDFPGYFAGASLKGATSATDRGRPGTDFPGYFAGASLKGRLRRLAVV